ncbi:MAG: NAD-binding protein [Promethearchaeota archaeon]
MVSRRITKLKILLKQNAYAFFIVLFWFGGNFLLFWRTTGELNETWKIVFFVKEGPGEYGYFYDSFTELIIFGLVFSLITVELFRKYNPEVTCREISRKMENHAIIIGYNNVGKRISEYFYKIGVKHVIIDKNRELLDDLISSEKPVICDDARSIQTLNDAGVKKAKAVFIMADNLEVQMVVNYSVRELNPHCKIIDRIFQDDIGELISTTYKADVISTSKFAASMILNKIKDQNFEKVLLIGMNHISKRLMGKFDKYHINYFIIEEDEEKLEDLLVDRLDPHLIIGDPKELTTMEQAQIRKMQCIVNLINDATNSVLITRRVRQLNSDCKIINRVFLDSVADMLEKPPFRCEVISSSKATLQILIRKGMLNFLQS